MVCYRITGSSLKIPIGKVICLARTYQKHAQEMDAETTKDPLLFLKPESSVIFDRQSIIIPRMSTCLHHEVEMGIVIGKEGKNIPKGEAMNHIFGYVVALDITARDLQSIAKQQGWPWSIAKGFDTFAPISDVVLKETISDPDSLDLELKINHKLKQQSNTRLMIYSVKDIIHFISRIMTLKRGDLILTGTPEGVGEIIEGDILEAKLGSFCSLTVTVKKE